MIMNSPEMSEVKDSSNNFILLLTVANMLIAGAALLFMAENSEALNNPQTQIVGYQSDSHIISTAK